jgi:predicted amidohydrolase YtcJ
VQGGTGHLSEGYHQEGFGGNGAQGDQEFFNQQVLKIYELGLWPAIHANGDGAVDVALNAVEFAQHNAKTSREIRPQIIHAQYTRPEQITRMAELKVNPTFFTTHVYYYGDVHHDKTLGPDPPVTPVDPLLNMWIAVSRKSSSGKVLGPDQAITPEQALQAYTINAAYQFGMEKELGSVTTGKWADLVILDRNPLKVNPDELRNIRVITTVRGGLMTYSEMTTYDHDDPPVE